MRLRLPEADALQRALLAAAALAWSVSFGLSFGIDVHNTYLIHGLHAADPRFLAADWLTTQTKDYHPVFSTLVRLLAEGGVARAGLIALNAACIGVAAFAIGDIARYVAPNAWLATALISLGLGVLTDTASVGLSSLFLSIALPATVAATLWVVAIAYFVRGRHVAAGVALAIGGLFHANFLVLGFPFFGLAILVTRPQFREWIRDGAALLGPSAVTLLFFLPMMLGAAAGPEADRAREIFQTVRSPHHYVPRTFAKEFIPFVGWVVAAAGVLALRRRRRDLPRHVATLFLSGVTLLTFATAFTTIVFNPTISQLYVFRLAPFVVLLAQVLVAAEVTSRLAPARALALALGFFATADMIPARRALGRSTIVRGLPGQEVKLYDWVRSTPRDALFLIPPVFQNFRLNAGRAIVVDWKSTPILPSELLEWYARLGAVAGDTAVRDEDAADSGYAAVSPARLDSVVERYSVDYVLFRRRTYRGAADRYTPVYSNRAFLVFATPKRMRGRARQLGNPTADSARADSARAARSTVPRRP